jgi:hypothetical protein
MYPHYEAPESRTCSGCPHYGVNLQTGAPPNKLGIPTSEAFFNRIIEPSGFCKHETETSNGRLLHFDKLSTSDTPFRYTPGHSASAIS